MKSLFLVPFLILGISGCGGGGGTAPGTYSCDERTAASSPQQYCLEYAGLTTQAVASPFQSACTGAWAAAGCPHTGSLGGCQAPASMGITATTWFYPDSAHGINSSADVMTNCSAGSHPGTYIAP